MVLESENQITDEAINIRQWYRVKALDYNNRLPISLSITFCQE